MPGLSGRKLFVAGMALCGAAVNGLYCLGLFKAYLDPNSTEAVREIIISALAPSLGWCTLLVWAALKPFERRHILLFAIVPMVTGNLLHSLRLGQDPGGSVAGLALNASGGLIFVVLFAAAFALSATRRFSGRLRERGMPDSIAPAPKYDRP